MMTPANSNDDVLYLSAVARILDVARKTAARYADDGLLPTRRDARGWRTFRRSDVDALARALKLPNGIATLKRKRQARGCR